MSTGIVIPYPHRTLQIGPYGANLRLQLNGIDPFCEMLTSEEVLILEFLANRLKRITSSLSVRWDCVPLSSWDKDLAAVKIAVQRRLSLPLFELEPAPGMVLAQWINPNLAAPLKDLRIEGLMRVLEQDEELYVAWGRFLGVPVYRSWGEIPRDTRIYVSAAPHDVKKGAYKFIVGPYESKAAVLTLSGGSLLQPGNILTRDENGEIHAPELEKMHGLGLLAPFVVKPASSSGSKDVGVFGGPRPDSMRQIARIIHAATTQKRDLVLQPYHAPRMGPRGWGEIWRINLIRTSVESDFRLIGGVGLSTQSNRGHGSAAAVLWPLLLEGQSIH